MSQRPFRFLHAADLHLDEPIDGLTEAPSQLVDRLIDCPLQAAERVFTAAIERRADFVVLSGDVIDPVRAAPRELLFLLTQFQRLADRQIPVYWAGGPIDSTQRWPSFVNWPANVHRASSALVERIQHQIDGVAVCTLVGRSHNSDAPQPSQFAVQASNDFTIAVVHANWKGAVLGDMGVNYWALGGSHERSTPLSGNCVAHDPGTPQGRRAVEIGPHGCTLVDVDAQRQIQLTPINCDIVRWHAPQVTLTTTDSVELEKTLRSRGGELCAAASGVCLLTTWKIACHGSLFAALRHGSLASDLTSKLRAEFANADPPLWTVTIEAELPAKPPATWFEEQTIRGDFLRVAEASSSGFRSKLFAADAPEEFADLLIGSKSDFEAAETNRQLVREASWLGAELVSPEEAVS